jgi:hypothetical protein
LGNVYSGINEVIKDQVMKKFLSLALLCAATIITSSANAGYKTKAEAIQAYNKVQAEYQKCVFNYNEARDSEYGSPELKCNTPYNQSLTRFIKDVRAESQKNAAAWQAINIQQTMVSSYNPSFFIRQSYMCESSAFTSLAQVAIDLSY